MQWGVYVKVNDMKIYENNNNNKKSLNKNHQELHRETV